MVERMLQDVECVRLNLQQMAIKDIKQSPRLKVQVMREGEKITEVYCEHCEKKQNHYGCYLRSASDCLFMSGE